MNDGGVLDVLSGIRARLSAIFVGFLLLVAGSVGASFFIIKAQETDALVINLAGRQRMLIQAMTKAALGMEQDASSNYRAELEETYRLFDRTLRALLDGGSVLYGDEVVMLPSTTSPDAYSQLREVERLWDRFRQGVEVMRSAEPESVAFARAMRGLESLSPVILREMDRAVRLYEAAAERKLARLRLIQLLFFLSAVGLLIAGYLSTQRTIVIPLYGLEAAARRMAEGDLNSPVEIGPVASDEIGALTRSFEDMRGELDASRRELEQRVEQRTEELMALFEVITDISSHLDIQQVLESIVDKVRDLSDAEVAALCLLDAAGEGLTATTTSGPAEAFATLPSEAEIEALDIVRVAEAARQHAGCECRFLRPRFGRSHLTMPLRVGGRLLGVLCVGHREERRFGEDTTRVLSLLANAGAIALENARLYQQAERSAALAERERIVAEIHDGLAQTLSFLNFRLGAVEGFIEDEEMARVSEQLTLIRRTVERTGGEVRRLMKDLQDSVHTSRTLRGQVQQTVERFIEERGMAIDLTVETRRPVQEPPIVYEQVVRVVQEALTNAYKHARDSRVEVTLQQDDGEAVVRIRDDGPGFDVQSSSDKEKHFGIKVMAARAERINGTLGVESAPGRGTTITLRWPLKEGRSER